LEPNSEENTHTICGLKGMEGGIDEAISAVAARRRELDYQKEMKSRSLARRNLLRKKGSGIGDQGLRKKAH